MPIAVTLPLRYLALVVVGSMAPATSRRWVKRPLVQLRGLWGRSRPGVFHDRF